MLSSSELYQSLRARIDDDTCRGPYSILVHATPGLGRSWLAASVASHARRRGHLVVSAWAPRHTGADGDGLVGHLLDELSPPRVGDRRNTSLAAAVDDCADAGPLVIVIDDLHEADTDSQLALLELPHRTRHPELLLVLTTSDAVARDKAGAWHHDALELRPLGAPSARGLAATLLPEETDQRRLENLVALSGGNPMLMKSLSRDLQDSAALSPGPSPCGAAFSQAIADSLARMPHARSVAAAIAVLSNPTRTAVHRIVDQSSTLSGLHSLVVNGLVDENLRFRHPAAVEVVLTTLDATVRTRLHDRAALCLSELGEPTVAVAEQLVRGSNDGSAWALETLLDAAECCLFEDRPEHRLAFLRKASGYATEKHRNFELLAAAARAEWRINPTAAERQMSLLRDRVEPEVSDPQHTGNLIRQLFWRGEFSDAAEFLRRMAARDDDNRAVAIELHFLREWLRLMLPIQAARLRDAFESAIPEGDIRLHTNLSARVRSANLIAGLVTGDHDRESVRREIAILAAESADERNFDVKSAVMAALIWNGYAADAEDWCLGLLDHWKGRNAQGWRTPFLAHLASIRLAAGDRRSAWELANQALQAMSPRAWGISIGQPLAIAIQAAIELGRLEDAERLVNRPVPDAMLVSMHGLHYVCARGQYYLHRGLPLPALADFQACGAMLSRWRRDDPRLLPWRMHAARAHAANGRGREARRVLREQLVLLGPQPKPVLAQTLSALADLTKGGEQMALLAKVVEVLRQCDDPVALGRAALAVGNEDQAHQLSVARRSVMRTNRINTGMLTLAYTSPAPSSAPRITGEPAKLLSEAEQRVALLAAQGDSNREIAEQLFITISTVEQHLTRIYRKLGVRRRTGLTSVLRLDQARTAEQLPDRPSTSPA